MTQRVSPGKPCKNGHISLRNAISGRCCECIANNYKKQMLNKERVYAKRKAWRTSNADRLLGEMRVRNKNNRVKISEQVKVRRAASLAKFRTASLKCYYKNKTTYLEKQNKRRAVNKAKERARYTKYYKVNKASYIHRCRKRQAVLLQRIPLWANMDAIKKFYIDRDAVSELTGVIYHVDHVIPLQGRTVSGLHVETNLQIITAKENLSKNSKYDYVAQTDRASAF